MKDYYKILNIEKTATQEEIKKAFRKLAHQYHPDKTKNDPASSAKFKEASEAYSVLSDEAKRKQYDTYGSAGPGAGFNPGAGGFGGQGSGFGGFDFSGFNQGGQNFEFDLGDIFGDLFGGRGGGSRQAARGSDISVDINLTFEESIFGIEKDILLTKSSKCLTCEGTGAEPGSSMETCPTCNGKGKINETRRSFIGVFNTSRVCDECHGKGKVPKHPCHTCHGEGVVEREQEISVQIPSGIEDGQMVRLTGMGEAISDGSPGDLYVRVHVRSHSHIRKEGVNLVSDLKIKLTQALQGGDVNFKSLDGDLSIRVPEGSNNGEVLRVKGKGVPHDRNKRGDLLVRLQVEMPRKLSKNAQRLVEEMKKEGI